MDTKTIASRITVAAWLGEERRQYADTKYADDAPKRQELIDAMGTEGLEAGGMWDIFIGNYMRRVQLFGVDTPVGQQALGKLIVTLLHAFETVVYVHGKPPMPGVSSGNIEPWVQFNA